MGPLLGPHAYTYRARQTQVAEPWLPAPRDGRPGGGQRLTPDAPHNGGRLPPPERPPTTPAVCSPPQGMQAKEQCSAPTPATRAHSKWASDPNSTF